VNGLMYVLSTGCQWRAIPKDLPPKSTVYDYFDLWTYDGTSAPPRIKATTLESQLIHLIQEPSGRTLRAHSIVSLAVSATQ
jgi:transposase